MLRQEGLDAHTPSITFGVVSGNYELAHISSALRQDLQERSTPIYDEYWYYQYPNSLERLAIHAKIIRVIPKIVGRETRSEKISMSSKKKISTRLSLADSIRQARYISRKFLLITIPFIQRNNSYVSRKSWTRLH